VHDSHDRYANIEINYLLKRIEEYAGLAILATGKRAKIDNAFSRRFHFVIRVPPRRKPRRK
jgi:SpoVK/Ycf46/Vps4 family AAA+-type ATPase